jgi:hypothetical protein
MKKLVIYDTEKLSFKPARLFVKVLVASIIANLLLLVALIGYTEPNIITKVKVITTIDTVHIGDVPLTDSAITAELVRLGCVLPNVALAQFKIESGHFKSAICRENFNLAGIKTSRSKYVIGKNRDHCVYRSYRDCLKDYVRIQNRYLKNIDGKYAAPGDYIKRISQVR